jgi:2,4-dienoyl-CoA reductase-like NADH-dependent reductase (Old Yellow Enzyme family)
MTHSGRYSKPQGIKAPVISHHDPYLDARAGVKPDQAPITDEQLEALQDKYAEVALLAKEAGFDGVDIKSCHRYLLSELLSSFTRENSRYGGSFENRTRFLLETVKKVKAAVGDNFILASRLNVFDAHPYPYGWGVSQESLMVPDMREPLALIGMLRDAGLNLLSNSAGNPYYDNPFVTRPLDTPDIGIPMPIEHPLESTARLFNLTKQVQQLAPEMVIIGNGYSWLRRYSCYAGAANVGSGIAGMMGYGRMGFAYPDAPKDILEHGQLFEKKECIACSKCTQIMRDSGTTGCVIRDGEVYLPLYNKFREQAIARN